MFLAMFSQVWTSCGEISKRDSRYSRWCSTMSLKMWAEWRNSHEASTLV